MLYLYFFLLSRNIFSLKEVDYFIFLKIIMIINWFCFQLFHFEREVGESERLFLVTLDMVIIYKIYTCTLIKTKQHLINVKAL